MALTTPKPTPFASWTNVTNSPSNSTNVSMPQTSTPRSPSSTLSTNLKCLQGSMNTSLPIPYIPEYCADPYAITCIRQLDSYSKFAVYTCSNSNCTKFGQVIRESVCVNINGQYYSNTICVNVSTYQTNCCCYGDGCNLYALPNLTADSTSNISTTPIAFTTPKPTPLASWANVTNNASNSTNISMPQTSTPKTSSSSTLSTNLKCLQGSMNLASPITYIPEYCTDPKAVTCIRQHNFLSKFVTFSCSTSNCTLNGQYVRDAICVNVSSDQTNCCCYGNDCISMYFSDLTNSTKPLPFSMPPAQPTPPVFLTNVTRGDGFNVTTSSVKPTSNILKCLQGSINTSLESTLIPTTCLDPLAVTCRSQYDATVKFATLTCSNSNCTLNALAISSRICVNVTSSQLNCCCYGDGCNSKFLPDPINTSLNPSLNPTNKTTITTSNSTTTTTSKDQTAAGCDESGYKILSTSADPSVLQGKFAGYLGFRTSCQQLCEKSFGLVKCFAYVYEQNNHGKCTIYQQPFENEKIAESPGSNVVVSKKC
uniref:Apple domain-containing protein n=1 Tax=Panagrolaimus sp. ES5 TaxID=591445 RepID=A0AC34GX62_9BILA